MGKKNEFSKYYWYTFNDLNKMIMQIDVKLEG
jgi:hypothetical protein